MLSGDEVCSLHLQDFNWAPSHCRTAVRVGVQHDNERGIFGQVVIPLSKLALSAGLEIAREKPKALSLARSPIRAEVIGQPDGLRCGDSQQPGADLEHVIRIL